ncbi:peptide-methionine (S)-S-oxide reductase [Staphylococcus aureus]
MTKEYATLAGGCFWCMVKPFTSSRHQVSRIWLWWYVDNPIYEQVCTNKTGHVEAVQITFDPEVLPLKIY